MGTDDAAGAAAQRFFVDLSGMYHRCVERPQKKRPVMQDVVVDIQKDDDEMLLLLMTVTKLQP